MGVPFVVQRRLCPAKRDVLPGGTLEQAKAARPPSSDRSASTPEPFPLVWVTPRVCWASGPLARTVASGPLALQVHRLDPCENRRKGYTHSRKPLPPRSSAGNAHRRRSPHHAWFAASAMPRAVYSRGLGAGKARFFNASKAEVLSVRIISLPDWCTITWYSILSFT